VTYNIMDKVRYSEDGKWVLSGVVQEFVGEEHVVIDTLIYGAYKVPLSGVTFMPAPKGIFTIGGEIPQKDLEEFRRMWHEATGEPSKEKT